MTIAALKKAWWWRKPQPEVVKGWVWKDGQEYGAFAWELIRLHPDAPELPPFPAISDLAALGLRNIFGKSQTAWSHSYAKKIDFEEGFSIPSIWDLSLPDNTLLEHFAHFIREQRQQFGIAPRPKPYETSKGPAWRWVELLDLDRHGMIGKAWALYKDGSPDPERTCREARTRMNEFWEMLSRTIDPNGRTFLQNYFPT